MITNPQNSGSDIIEHNSTKKIFEVRFTDIFLFFSKYLVAIAIATVVFGILGVILSFSFKKKYESRIVLLPEYGSSRKSSLSLLTSGLTGDGAEKLLPELYPTILQSSPFGAYLLNKPVTDQNNKSYKTLQLFLNRNAGKKSPGLLSWLFPKPEVEKAPVKLAYNGVLSYTPEEQANISQALSLFNASVDQKNGVIEITAETEDPFVSAIAVENAKNYLMQYVEDYRTTKAGQNLNVLKNRVAEARQRLSQSEVNLQSYRDRNRNMFANVARIEEQRLQSEYILAQSLYSDLVGRYEQARITIKDEKPVFKTLEPAKVPLAKSSPKRLRIGIMGACFGAFISILYILFIKEKILSSIIEMAKVNRG
ncbi:hypothetical protein [Dyadobacter sp. CY326]|uniref:hypothetical protein n=1 Tax=Dyadobacter sp. CY326 TaxID=2907300 RepID=UPI001F2D7FBB|nr:hypothetical protein [Dyadobacter sp. CY326]MCE7065384.1 hypothetical protein [Dyadobacter sp. CY326]